MKQFFTDMKTSCMGFLKTDKYNTVLYIIVLVLFNIFAYTYNFNLDITSERVYSLSSASKQSVKNLNEPFSIKVFFSAELPAPYSNVRLYLRDLLESYDAVGGQNFSFEFYDMNDEESKEAAASYGIRPVQVTERKSDQFTASQSYMGLVMVHGDLIEQIPQVGSSSGLEYQITTLIRKMRSKVDILSGMEEQIKLTLYVSENLKMFNINGLQKLEPAIEEVVELISQENSGKVDYAYQSDLSQARISELIAEYGITPISWGESKLKDGTLVEAGNGIVAIVVESGDKFTTLNMGVVQSLFGYQVSGLDNLSARIKDSIDQVLSNNPVIGYLVSGGTVPLQGQQGQKSAMALNQLLSDMYEVKPVDLTSGAIPENVKTLIINGPSEQFTESELYYIDSFVMRGGNLVVFAEAFREIMPQGGQMQYMQQPVYLPLSTGVDRLLATYGVTVGKDYVLDTHAPEQMDQRTGQLIKHYYAPQIDEAYLNQKSIITKKLKRLLLLKASSLTADAEKLKEAGITLTELFTSSEESWKMEGRISLNPLQIREPDPETMSKSSLALLLEGAFPSHFASGLPEELKAGEEGQMAQNQVFEKGIAAAKIFVIATSEITTEQLLDPLFGANPRADFLFNNSVFVHNVVDYVNGNTEIPGMRGKGAQSMLKEVSDTSKLVFKSFNIAALPILSVLLGLVILQLRSARKRRLQKLFSTNDKEAKQ